MFSIQLSILNILYNITLQLLVLLSSFQYLSPFKQLLMSFKRVLRRYHYYQLPNLYPNKLDISAAPVNTKDVL